MRCSYISSAVVLLVVVSGAVSAQERWGSDYLIGHFDQGISDTGLGYSNFDCMYGSASDVFVGFVEHTTEPGTGDISTIRKSFDNGANWTRQNGFSGGTLALYSPSLCEAPWDGNILYTCVVQQGSDSTSVTVWVYDYGSLSVILANSHVDYSYPGAAKIVYSFVVSNNKSGEVWSFSVDENNWLFLSRSSDAVNWTSSTPVAANVTRPSAVVSSDGSVAVTWINSTSGDAMCTVSDEYGNFQPSVTVSSTASSQASPVPAWEHLGDKNLGVVWHSSTGKSYITISSDNGLSWGDAEYIGDGIYPYINSFPGTQRMGVCYTNAANEVEVTNAATLGDVSQSPFVVRSQHEATLNGPSKTVFGQNSDQLALFFLTPSTEDFYYNNSLLSGVQNPETDSVVSVSPSQNPVDGLFSLTADGFSGPVQYRIFNITGRLVEQSQPVTGSYSVASDNFPSGLYTVTASGDGKIASCRVIRI